MRRPVVICALVLAVVPLWAVAPASAAHGIQYGIQDDAWLLNGPGTLTHRLDFVQNLGVTTVRFTIHWDTVAPTRPARALAANDPAYHWSGIDDVLEGLHARGIQPLVTLYGTPGWANGHQKPNVAPKSSSTFANFAYAVAKRYRFVRKWTIWNEPNQRLMLANTSPGLYVKRLLNPAYVALHRASSGVLVAGGVTAPRGNQGGFGPLGWVRGMAAAHAKLDAYAHNPYATQPQESPLRGACPYCDVISISNLTRLTKEVHRDLGAKPIWLTEYGYQTNPPDSFGVSPNTQAQYVSEAAMRTYQLPGVTMLIQYLIRDEPLLDRFQTGLFTVRGVAKPAYYAFRFPLAQVTRSGTQTSLWGQIRPGKGARTYRLQIRIGGAWKWSGPTRHTTGSGFFAVTVPAPRGALVRVWSPQQRAYGWPLLIR
jgi:Glycosyl hydrolase family 1